jgi:hypothetical protein
VLTETTDPVEIHKYEESFATDPWYIHLYRTGHAYHGVHPFYMWYWCAHALEHLGGSSSSAATGPRCAGSASSPPRRSQRVKTRFPWGTPTWPQSLSRPVPKENLGADYDTSWARSYPARMARVLLLETLITRPAVKVLASPTVRRRRRRSTDLQRTVVIRRQPPKPRRHSLGAGLPTQPLSPPHA